VYDYDRRDTHGRARELHVDKAMQVMRFGEQKGGKVQAASVTRDGVNKTFFTACPYFTTEKWELAGPLQARTSPEHFDLLTFLDGSGEITWNGEHATYGPAQTWMLPAALGEYGLNPSTATTLLRAYVPCDWNSWKKDLRGHGFSEEECSRLRHG
jgi:mannose-6-phosphate isomerase